MNKFSNKNIIKNLAVSNSVKIYPLQMTVTNKSNLIRKSIAINESINFKTKQDKLHQLQLQLIKKILLRN